MYKSLPSHSLLCTGSHPGTFCLLNPLGGGDSTCSSRPPRTNMTPAPLQSSTPLPRIRALRAFCMSTHFNFHYWTKQITGWAGASGASWILLQAVQETFRSAAANQQQCCIHFIASVSSTLQIIPEANITKTRVSHPHTHHKPQDICPYHAASPHFLRCAPRFHLLQQHHSLGFLP